MKKIKNNKKLPDTKRYIIPIVAVLVAIVGFLGYNFVNNSNALNIPQINTDTAKGYSIPLPPTGNKYIYVGESIPSGAPSGSTLTSSLKSAYNSAIAGDIIIVRPKSDGSPYREGWIGINKQVSIYGEPGKQVWFDGTLDTTSGDPTNTNKWSLNANGNYELTWYTPDFCSAVTDNPNTTINDTQRYYYPASTKTLVKNTSGTVLSTQSVAFGNDYTVTTKDANGNVVSTKTYKATEPCSHDDMSLDPANPMAWDPQAVYLNGEGMTQSTNEGAITNDNTFYYKRSGNTSKIVINFLPSSAKKVEITKYPILMLITSDNVKVSGIGIRKYATNEHESGNTNGAIYAVRANLVIDKIVAWRNSANALKVLTDNSINVKVTNSQFVENGFNGMGVDKAPNILVENNVFGSNNQQKYGLNCDASCAHAGMKMAHMQGGTIKKNLFINNNGHGWWCDLSCDGVKVINNTTQNNTKSGIFYEVSQNAIIASNLLIGDNQGIRVAGPNVRIYNNTTLPNGSSGVFIQQDKRLGTAGYPPAISNVSVVNNIIKGGINTDPTKLQPSQYSLVNNDSINSNESQFFINPTGNYLTGNYILKTTSTAYRTGNALPNDIANLLGVATSPVNKGALSWYTENNVTPTNIPEGLFKISNNGGYDIYNSYGSSYCSYDTWDNFVALTGKTDASDVPIEPSIPSTMTNLGVCQSATKLGDINGDNKVDIFDLSILLNKWNINDVDSDLNNDGTVNVFDLSILLNNWTI